MATAATVALLSVVTVSASAATPQQLDLKVLLIGGEAGDPTTAAWQSALTSEGVPFTLASASGSYGAETVTLPALSSGSVGDYNGVIFADSPAAFAASSLTALDSYEGTFHVRQLDGYSYPFLGETDASAGALDGTTGTLTSTALAALPELKGPIPFDTGTYGYPATANSGAPLTPWLTNSAGQVLAGVYQHPGSDAQSGVSELQLNFDYNSASLQFLLLAPGLINWVTQNTHLGLYRNYFGEDVDDVMIADNEWSSQYQCTPAATDPVDVGCPAAAQGNPAYGPPDQQMTAADVAYVANWEAQTGIKLEFAFNAAGACSAPSATTESTANCTGSTVDNGTTYTDPGVDVDPSNPNDAAYINALLANQADFNWITHTWSHLYLGCNVWQPLATNPIGSNSSGSLAAGTYTYEVAATTAYGESEPSTPQTVTVGANGEAVLSWPDATNGGGPSLSTLESEFSGGTGFWGYSIYRQDPGSSTFGLVGQIPEDSSGALSTYYFLDNGTTAPGAGPETTDSYPTATNPGIECAGSNGNDWTPATATDPTTSIEGQIGLDVAFAKNNGLTNYNPNAVITGEHSGLESPQMPTAMAGTGIQVFGSDGSRQPDTYTISSGSNVAHAAPRYPSNMYYNAANWRDELNEYNTLYVAPGVSMGDPQYPSETGRCASSSVTTCQNTPATEQSLLASESHIMLSHVLANNPRVGYAHQSNLIGPATQTVNGATSDYGYTLINLINDMLNQYNSWYTAPLQQITDASESQTLAEQSAWASTSSAGSVTATEQNGNVTITDSGTAATSVPVTVPAGSTVNGQPFGQSYGGTLSEWLPLNGGASTTVTESVAPTIISGAAGNSIVGAPFSFTVSTTGAPTPALTETGALPGGITFTDNGDGTATIAGTSTTGTGGSYPITINATSSAGSASQSFTLTNAEAPSITSPNTATFVEGSAGSYAVTTTGYPAATVTEAGTLPSGLTFTAKPDGTATIAGTAASGTSGTYPVTIKATNASGSTAVLNLTITVQAASGPAITSGAAAYFTVGTAGAFAITATGAPTPAITETGALPAGLTFTDQGNGTALLQGTPTGTGGTTNLTMTATNASGTATQQFSLIVDAAPAFTNAATSSFTAGSAGSFTVTTSGYPAATITESGALPSGLTFTNKGDGTGTIAGTPAATSGGPYTVTLTAANGIKTTSAPLAITVNQKPAITSKATASGSTFHAFSFPITATGYPKPTITESGSLPLGLKFSGGANGSATISGTPIVPGTFKVTINAKSTAGTATQGLTISIAFAFNATTTPGGMPKTGVGSSGTKLYVTPKPATSASTAAQLPPSHYWWHYLPFDF
ncbi:MAG TPA: Ig domain-containing protein [Pseudonocardiaceae bacterium]|nr:Ig domain-containing protein [Pseudonocardiaceae bacterium]